MLSATPLSNVFAAEPRINPGRILVALFLLTIACVAHGELFAQGSSEDPEARFYSLLDDNGYSLDDARETVAREFGSAVAVDIAVYLCSPPPDKACEGSEAWAAWIGFLDRIYELRTVDQVVQDMIQADFDGSLVAGIADYWCLPEPEPGPGCTDTAQISDLDGFLAELIAESECEDPACGEEDGLPDGDEDEASDQSVQPQQQAGEKSPARASALQFGNHPKRVTNRIRSRSQSRP